MARASDAITVKGLREFKTALRKFDGESHKKLRVAQNDAAQLVVNKARPKVPVRSGKARNSMRVASTQTATRIRAGGKRVPYYPWLDFGGRVGKNNSVNRPFIKQGRYIFPTYSANKGKVQDILAKRIEELARESGLM